MKIYTNISYFMSTHGITYHNRIVLNIIGNWISDGYDVIPYIVDSENIWYLVDTKLFAKYYIRKQFGSKDKYITNNLINMNEITENDIYYEIDTLWYLSCNWSQYYKKIINTGCQFSGYLYYLRTEFTNNKMFMAWYKEYIHNIKTLFVSDQKIANSINNMCGNNVKIDILSLENFKDSNFDDSLLPIDIGIKQIISEGMYITCLFEPDKDVNNIARYNKIVQSHKNMKILVILPADFQNTEFEKYLFRQKNIGYRIFILKNVSYYTILNVYRNCDKLLVPANGDFCKFEIIHALQFNINIDEI
ncbi:hypothetical protein LJC58_08030 [Lachnospiraceae bacterium OttesenSCG-928-D06]|nr:hypothetical protein [Lachnospiraceae bacterium OttesenSCG-928-D06]